MFFSKDHFRKYFDDVESQTIARICNEIIDNHGVVIYGNAYNDDKLNNFSTDQKIPDTHVMIGIGLSEMGIFQSQGNIKTEKPTESELVKIMEKRTQALEREAKALRSNNGKHQ